MAYIIIGLCIGLLGVIAYRTIKFKVLPTESIGADLSDIKGEQIADKLSAAIQIPTVSYRDRSKIDYQQFEAYHERIEKLFPKVHSQLTKKVINDYSLLYHWKGKAPSKGPALYMAHIDVVPIAEGTEEDWTYPPFSGAIEEGYVWGRGSLDTKVTMISALEAAELLLEEGFQPEEDIYFAFGHDEEIRGDLGAKAIAGYLKEEGIQIRYIIDEGGVVNIGSIPGVDRPTALIGICEKGYSDIKVSVEGQGGHASMPPKTTALGQISEVVRRLEKNQMPIHFGGATRSFMKTVGPAMGLTNRVILANLWLFKPVFLKIFQKSASGNALLRTTTAATMSHASNASNVLPQKASATFNFRINPEDTVEDVKKHILKVSGEIPVALEILQGTDPSRVSSTESQAFQRISETIGYIFGDVLVSPYVMLAATDSIQYENVCKDIYRFAPYVATKEALSTIHNTNERISIDNLIKSVGFYKQLISGE